VVRLQGVLTAAEQQLVKSDPAEKGRDLLKQVRAHLIENGATDHGIDGPLGHRRQDIEPASRHEHRDRRGDHVFTLAEAPDCRQPKKRQS